MSKLLKQLNDNQNKVADTNGIMKLQAWDYGVAQDLTNKQITATVANASGFLFDLDLVSNGTEIDLDFKDSQLQKLTPDTYFLEIKVTDKDGDISVFPTEGYATFTINKNLHATEGALVPQITFDTVLADVKTAMDEKVADYVKTIAKGDKGDPGKDAEMPIIGGRNYILNSERTLSGPGNISDTGWVNTSITISKFSNSVITVSAQFDYDSITALNDQKRLGFEVVANQILPDGSMKNIGFSVWVNPTLGSNFHGRKSSTYNLTNQSIVAISDSSPYKWVGGLYIKGVVGTNVSISNPKIEIGNVATDWTPALEDIDSTYVKKSGDTMTGGLMGGQINLPISGDLNMLTDTGKYYQNISVNAANWLNRPSNAPDRAFSVDVIGQANHLLTTQVYYVHTTSRMWVRTMWLDGSMNTSEWTELANDSNVVHNTGNEVIAGDKTLVGNTNLATTTMLAGNYGLRVTTSGIQKTTDGKTWVSANI